MSEITIIANNPEGTTGLDDVVFVPKKLGFVLGIPDSVIDECGRRGIDTRFFTQHAPSYFNFDSLADLQQAVKIDRLDQRIEKSVHKIANIFMERIEKASLNNTPAPFNGPTYGISAIRTARDPADERLTMQIDIHPTSYLTSAIMGDVYKGLRAENADIVSDANLVRMPQINGVSYGLFFNSFGLNASVALRDHYIFGVRPNGDLHVAMNEGLRPSPDLPAQKSFTLDILYRRGMREELGLKVSPELHIGPPSVRELFLWKAAGQFGIHMMTRLDMSLEELMMHHDRAIDRYENQKFVAVAFNRAGFLPYAERKTGIVPYTPDLVRGLLMDMR